MVHSTETRRAGRGSPVTMVPAIDVDRLTEQVIKGILRRATSWISEITMADKRRESTFFCGVQSGDLGKADVVPVASNVSPKSGPL
jgi:hypothetical protein